MNTMVEIAKRAGVSVSTVSRALSGNPRISERTRSLIERIATQLDYAPNLNAKALRIGTAGGLAIITCPCPSQIVDTRNNFIFMEGQAIFGRSMIYLKQADETLDKAINLSLANGCQCIIVSSAEGLPSARILEILSAKGIPMVFLDGECKECDSIAIDRAMGMYQATRLTLISGAKRPVYYSNFGNETPDGRTYGIAAAYKSLGRPLSEIQLVKFDIKPGSLYAQGAALTKKVLESYPADSIFCSNDELAIGALKTTSAKGLRVPADLRVTGFDDIPVADFAPVPLTTVRQPVEEAVKLAMELVMRRLDNPSTAPVRTVLPTNLVIRESSPADRGYLEQVFDMGDYEKARRITPCEMKKLRFL